ncbi:uncharacterized protein LOC132285041 isoform X2 [Cornus florida]|uniref:uncharacterized protein LOC132285041 isoform X2 n=1 Tax=Cornus florida TaxID=4283 RepID=UPI0028A2CC56|nr:uncharacterized protein LOC132285041 isoform X2 [Cornus florida]
MALAPERSRPLHHFTLPRLRWGNRRLLRCMKVNANDNAPSDRRSSPLEADSDGCNRIRDGNSVIKRRSLTIAEDFKKSPLKPIYGDKDWDDNGIEAFREKLMFDLRLVADKMKVPIHEDKAFEVPTPERPWNLRTPRAACKAPNDSGKGGGGGNGKGENLRSEERRNSNCNSSPVRAKSQAKSSGMRGLAAAAATTAQCLEKREQCERPRFSISLSREEIVSDFLAMAGTKPNRRPTKKRPKIVQKNLDSLFPGLWLTEITLHQYKVPDFQEPRKRGRIEA